MENLKTPRQIQQTFYIVVSNNLLKSSYERKTEENCKILVIVTILCKLYGFSVREAGRWVT